MAVDVGGTKTAVGLVRRDGRVLAWRMRPAGVERGPDAMISDYVMLAEEVVREAGVAPRDTVGIGVGCGGPLNPWTGVVYGPANLPGWEEVPLAARLSEALGLPAFVENDANAAALAEYWYGAGRGFDPLVYFTVSTGIGAGVIIRGEIYEGATGNAAELGHTVVRVGGRPCRCGGRGCLEAYCSGTSIAERAREALARGDEQALASGLGSLGRPPRAEDVVALARAGDPLARSLWEETVDVLAAGVVNAIHAFNPRRVVLGGGVTRAGEDLFRPLRARVQRLGMRALVAGVEVVPAQLGDLVGVLGAGAVAFLRTERGEAAGYGRD